MFKFLVIAFLTVPCIVFSQDKFILTKEQHDELRKNIDDYKVLIKKFDEMKQNFDNLVKEFELTKALKSNQKIEFDKILAQSQLQLNNADIKYNNLKKQNDDLQMKILTLNKQLEYTVRSSTHWRNKYQKEIKWDRGDRIVANCVWAIMVSATLMIIYESFEQNWAHRP